MYAGYQSLTFERHDSVLQVALNSGMRHNAIDGLLHRELSTVFAEIARDKAVRAVLLTGSGPSFSAGGDIGWVKGLTGDNDAIDVVFEEGRRIIGDLLRVPQPVVAAVSGPVIGLAASIVLSCDVIIAAEDAKFGDPHVMLGLVAGDGGALVWPALVGPARAKQYLFTGDIIRADEAERIGLINTVVPKGEAVSAGLEFAQRLAAGAPKAIQGTKAAVNAPLIRDLGAVLDLSLARERETFWTADHQEGIAAFEQGRPPEFTGQ